MHSGGEELGAGGFGLGEFGFQGIAQGQQIGDLGDDSLLLGEGWEWNDDVLAFRHRDVVLTCGTDEFDVFKKQPGAEVDINVFREHTADDSMTR